MPSALGEMALLTLEKEDFGEFVQRTGRWVAGPAYRPRSTSE